MIIFFNDHSQHKTVIIEKINHLMYLIRNENERKTNSTKEIHYDRQLYGLLAASNGIIFIKKNDCETSGLDCLSFSQLAHVSRL